MNWKKIDPENLPSGEVLFKSGYHPHVYFGRLVLDDDEIWCEKEEAYFNSVSHYFNPSDLGEPETEMDKIVKQAEEDIKKGDFEELTSSSFEERQADDSN